MSASIIAAAHVSGPLGQALAVVDGETWLFDAGRDRRRPTANDIRFFFDFGLEVRPLSPSETAVRGIDDLRALLEAETRRFRALRGLLIGMDSELDEDLRQRGMRRSETLLGDRSVAEFVETRFLRPVDGQPWTIAHALALSREAGLRRVERLYTIVDGPWLLRLEDKVREWTARQQRASVEGAVAVRRAYDTGLIATLATGIHDADRVRVRALLFQAGNAGWDPHLVTYLVNFAAPREATPAIVQPEPDEAERPAPSPLGPIERARAKVEAALEAWQSDRPQTARRVPGGGAASLDPVLKQIGWIVGQFQAGHDRAAWGAVGDLAQRQLGRGDPDYLAQSLTNIATQIPERYATATALHELAALCAPDDPTVWTAQADLLMKSGHLPDALDAYDRTVEQFPDNVVARTGRAETLRALGRLPDALDTYDRTTERFPDNVVARNGRAETLRALGRLPDALDAYDRTVERFPDDAYAWTSRAETLRALGRLPDALDAYDRTIEQFPDNVVARTGRAMVLIDLGRADEARLSLLAAGTAPRQTGDWIAAHVLCMIDLRAGATPALADRLQHLVQTCPYPGQRRYFETTHAVVQLALRRHAEARRAIDGLLARPGFEAGEQQVLHLMQAHAAAAQGDLRAARQSLAAASNVVPSEELVAHRLRREIERRYGLGGGRPLTHRTEIAASEAMLSRLEGDAWIARNLSTMPLAA